MAFRVVKTLTGGLAGMALALVCALATPASAGGPTVDWTVNGTFDDGGVFFGTFTYDGSTDSVTKWHITTTTPTSDPDYTADLGTFQLSSFPPGVGFSTVIDPDTTDFLQMYFPLEIPATVDIFGGYEAQQLDIRPIALFSIIHTVDSGTAVGVAAGAPEPALWSTLILGFGLAGGALRRRERRTVA